MCKVVRNSAFLPIDPNSQTPLNSRYGQSLMDLMFLTTIFPIPTFDEGASTSDLDGPVLGGRSSAVHRCWEICRGSTFRHSMATTQKRDAAKNAARPLNITGHRTNCCYHHPLKNNESQLGYTSCKRTQRMHRWKMIVLSIY